MMTSITRTILAIETSCDETAIAIVRSDKVILGHTILSQTDHLPYGGVVPELAARAHIDHIDALIEQTLQEADLPLAAMDGFAATAGPGLIGGLLVGVMTAKALASSLNKPFLPVNHLEGHALSVRLTEEVPFPFLLLLVSGGHCQFLLARALGDYHKLGGTLDDALGEAFDKVAKMLGLAYPGGPIVEQMARQGDPKRFGLPRSLVGREGCDLSFSGLKSAVRREIELLPAPLSLQDKADICASFQQTIADILDDRVARAIALAKADLPELRHLVVAGGVAANLYLREKLSALAEKHQLVLKSPPLALCTDNAAMIAWAALEHLDNTPQDMLEFEPRARWPLPHH